MKKVLGVFLIALGVFALGGMASASTADILQPAGATTSMESLRVGVAGQGGVTFFNGSIVNESGPIVIADDMRIDGEIWRGPSKGTSDNQPLKVSDTVIPTLTNSNDLGTGSNRWKGIYGVTGDFSGSVTSNGRVLGQTLAEAISSGGGVAGAPGQALTLTASTWTGSTWSIENGFSKNTAATIVETTGVTLSFVPTSLTEGTFSASEDLLGGIGGNVCGGPICLWGTTDHSIRTGSYTIIGDTLFLTNVLPLPEEWTEPTPPNSPFTQHAGFGGRLGGIKISGDVMTIGDTTLIKQP